MARAQIDRRTLIRGTVAVAGVAALGGIRSASAGPGKPTAIATWRHGVAAVAMSGRTLSDGGSALDAAEKGVNIAELDPDVGSVGYGGRPNAEGIVELDACIMDGTTREAGAVASLRGCKTPISVARMVMDKTRHVMLVGAGARKFATSQGFEDGSLLTTKSLAAWEKWKAKQAAGEKGAKAAGDGDDHDTIGLLTLDANGHLAAACTTSGLAWKIPGRVGDSPIVGAGLYAEDGVGAATATGVGEEVIKVCGSFLIVERMRMGDSPQEACETALHRILDRIPGHSTSVAFLALAPDGSTGAASIKGGFTYGMWVQGQDAQELKVGALAR